MSNRRVLVFVIPIVLAMVMAPQAASAQGVVDQYDLAGDINWAIHSGSDIGQVITSGAPEQLLGIELALGRCANPTNPLILEILTTIGGVPQPGPVLASLAIPNASITGITPPTGLVLGSITGTYVDLSAFGITAQTGAQYAFRLSTAEGVCYSIRGDTAANYPGGQRFTNWTLQTSDLVFKTFTQDIQNIEPIPSSSTLGLVLFLTGIVIAAFVLLRR